MTLGDWQRIWNECACAVESQEVDASTWGNAIEWTLKRENAFGLDVIADDLDPKTAAPIIDRIIVAVRGGKSSCRDSFLWNDHLLDSPGNCTAWILSLKGSYVCDQYYMYILR